MDNRTTTFQPVTAETSLHPVYTMWALDWIEQCFTSRQHSIGYMGLYVSIRCATDKSRKNSTLSVVTRHSVTEVDVALDKDHRDMEMLEITQNETYKQQRGQISTLCTTGKSNGLLTCRELPVLPFHFYPHQEGLLSRRCRRRQMWKNSYERSASGRRRRIVQLVWQVLLRLSLQCLQYTKHVQRQLRELHLCRADTLSADDTSINQTKTHRYM